MNTGLKFALGVCSLSLLFSCAQKLPYQDTSLTAEQRAEDLLPRLTLEEKVALMQNASPAIPRLGIKEYDWWNEALHGVGRAGLATVFPQAIGMGASFNDSLLYEVFDAVSDEARVKSRIFSENGVLKRYQGLTFWTPNVNIFRDPRWGRGQETYGEDPYLTGQLGMAVVRGLQGQENGKYDNCMLVPNTSPSIPDRSGTATVLMRRILLPGIYGRLTCRLSKTWCRKRM